MAVPTLTLPAALCGDDGGFTRDSLRRRLPAILDEVLALNADTLPAPTVAAIQGLRDEIAADGAIPKLLVQPSPHEAWDSCTAPYVGQRWCQVPWFFAELYAYRRLLDAIREHGGPADPFRDQKQLAMTGATSALVETVLPLTLSQRLRDLILRSLWGNRADLSLTGGKPFVQADAEDAEDISGSQLLVDNCDAAEVLLRRHASSVAPASGDATTAAAAGQVIIVLDNCGLELLSDLVLVDGLLRTGAAQVVTLQAKAAPVFVSDALPQDVLDHIEFLSRDELGRGPGSLSAALQLRLRGYLERRELLIEAEPFYTSPAPMWDMPAPLRERLARAKLVIAKGDANYRRLLGDRHWPHAAPFDAVTAYFPAPLLALRTCKAGVVCGIPPETEARIASRHADWLTSGRFGMVQLRG